MVEATPPTEQVQFNETDMPSQHDIQTELNKKVKNNDFSQTNFSAEQLGIDEENNKAFSQWQKMAENEAELKAFEEKMKTMPDEERNMWEKARARYLESLGK